MSMNINQRYREDCDVKLWSDKGNVFRYHCRTQEQCDSLTLFAEETGYNYEVIYYSWRSDQ